MVTIVLPFPMISVRSYLPPAPSTRRLPRAAKHGLSCDLASALPPVTSHESPVTNSFRFRTYEKHVRNSFRIRTYKTQDLKPFRMNTYKKTGEGAQLSGPMPARSVGARHVVPSFFFFSGS